MKRSGFVRKAPTPAEAVAPKPRLRKCGNPDCRKPFRPFRPLEKWCSPECGVVLAKLAVAKKERKNDLARRRSLKTRRDYLKEAQANFNAFIRERDKSLPCICCGEPLGKDAIGGGYDAGHYRSVGSAPHLRFDERNVHAQRKHCNRYGAGRAVDYRIGLIARIGLAAVEALESEQAPRKWAVPDLQAIALTYKVRLKELQRRDMVAF